MTAIMDISKRRSIMIIEEEEDEECEMEAWDTLRKSFSEAQNVLDQNRLLIMQVNENHQSKLPDNMVKNMALIREINGNILKILSIYSDLSVNFANVVNHKKALRKQRCLE